jgi:hypothetical protein
MLIINVKEQEFYDSEKGMFFNTKPASLRMEHSLISIAKWEAFWEKPYLRTEGMTPGISGIQEERYYIKCMIIGDVANYIPDILMQNHVKKIQEYIVRPYSATKVYRRGPQIPRRQIVTTELIYYWMIRFGIPMECQRWHFNRLLMLIDVCNVKDSAGGKKGALSSADAAKYMHELNKARQGL